MNPDQVIETVIPAAHLQETPQAITIPEITRQAITPQEQIILDIEPTYKCACCSDVIEGDEGTNSVDGLICESCRDDDYFYCEQCEEIHHNDNLILINDSYYCSRSCANAAGWIRCADCSDWVSDSNSYNNSNNDSVCESCSENYYSCDNCGDIVHADDICRDRSDNCYCESCFGDRNDNDTIKEYSYKPSEYIYAEMPWENTTYLGIELEVEAGTGGVTDKAEKVIAWLVSHKLDNMVYLKEDSSLDNGFEIVFMPQTLQAIHKKFPMKSFLGYLQSLGLTSHKKGSCGLHVHLSRRGLSTLDIWKGKIFFFKCADYLKRFSARRDGKSSLDDIDIFNFCKFDNSMPVNGSRQEHGRYSAFNTCNTSTVEIRLFRGTLIYDRFQASIQFSDAFASYIQSVGVCYLKSSCNNVIWNSFIDYCKRSNKYGQFVKYILKKGII